MILLCEDFLTTTIIITTVTIISKNSKLLGWILVAVIDAFLFSSQGLYQGGFGYHLAISGKSFAALCDHFPEYLPKVMYAM